MMFDTSRFGGLKLSAIEQPDSYLSGKTDAMDELAAPRHRHYMSGFVIYKRITAPVYS